MSIAVAEPTNTLSTLTLHSVAHTNKTTHVSTSAIALGVVAALVLLTCLVWALTRLLAVEPRWTLSLRHSLAEARFRASATWAEFSDWARLGR
jgi:hypothetical protein